MCKIKGIEGMHAQRGGFQRCGCGLRGCRGESQTWSVHGGAQLVRARTVELRFVEVRSVGGVRGMYTAARFAVVVRVSESCNEVLAWGAPPRLISSFCTGLSLGRSRGVELNITNIHTITESGLLSRDMYR